MTHGKLFFLDTLLYFTDYGRYDIVESDTGHSIISGVMVNVLTSSAVDRVFEPRSEKTKYYEIGICFFFAKHAALRKK